MERQHHFIVITSLLLATATFGGDLVAAEPGFETIFDGKSLQGWASEPKLVLV